MIAHITTSQHRAASCVAAWERLERLHELLLAFRQKHLKPHMKCFPVSGVSDDRPRVHFLSPIEAEGVFGADDWQHDARAGLIFKVVDGVEVTTRPRSNPAIRTLMETAG